MAENVLPDSALDLRYEHAFDIQINFDKRWMIGPIAGAFQFGYTSVGENSLVSGPMLNGRLVDYSGADWPLVRPDKVVELNAHYMIETDDGVAIYINNRGYVHGPLLAAGQGEGDTPAIPAYFRCTPYFRAPDGKYDWLNRTVMVGVGQRKPRLQPGDAPDHSLFRYYVIR